jgi:hypothetical protein
MVLLIGNGYADQFRVCTFECYDILCICWTRRGELRFATTLITRLNFYFLTCMGLL